MDAFSELMQLFRMRVEVYHNAKVCGDWRINAHTLGSTCFHIVTSGRCHLDVPGHLACDLNKGDLVIFPRELEHTMRQIEGFSGKQQHLSYHQAKNIPGTGMLCGEVKFQHHAHKNFLDALPKVFIIKYQEKKHWLDGLLPMIVAESLNPTMASQAILSRLSELLFTYAIRQYLQENPTEMGLLALYQHPRLAMAITAIHQHPAYNWTLQSLSEQALLSRTVFAQAFKKTSGWTAMQYVSWWRMQLAWRRLSAGESSSEVAALIGYKSEAAFSRAFQKQFNISAGKVRRGESG